MSADLNGGEGFGEVASGIAGAFKEDGEYFDVRGRIGRVVVAVRHAFEADDECVIRDRRGILGEEVVVVLFEAVAEGEVGFAADGGFVVRFVHGLFLRESRVESTKLGFVW